MNPDNIPLFGDDIPPELAIYEFPKPYVGKHVLVDRPLMSSERFPWYALEFYVRDAYYAVEMLDLPKERMTEFVEANWNWIRDPSTTTNQLASELGLEVQATPIDIRGGRSLLLRRTAVRRVIGVTMRTAVGTKRRMRTGLANQIELTSGIARLLRWKANAAGAALGLGFAWLALRMGSLDLLHRCNGQHRGIRTAML